MIDFSPLRQDTQPPGVQHKVKAGWQVIVPVPLDAPSPPNRHKTRGEPSFVWAYRDADQQLLGYVCRFDQPKGGKEFAPLTWCQDQHGQGAWRWKSWPVPRPLYGLDRFAGRAEAPVMVCEGEKAADAAALLLPDHVAISAPNGSNAAGKADWRLLAGRQVIIWPDADAPGCSYAETAAKMLVAVGANVSVILPPAGVMPGWDAADALVDGWTGAQIGKLVAAARPIFSVSQPLTVLPGYLAKKGSSRPRSRQSNDVGPPQRDRLIALSEGAEFWHSPEREAFATVRVGILVGALRPEGPFPILIVNGEQGTSKSTLTRMLVSLLDPRAASLRSLSRDERDLAIAAHNARVLAFDNISGISNLLSDALCRLSTGGGFGTRELHSDRDEVLFDEKRPVIINGIPDFATRPDLGDRAIAITLKPISRQERRTESALWQDFETAWPEILGALLDAVSSALRNLGSVTVNRPERMADFVHWLTAAEPGLGWPPGTFAAAYRGNRQGAVE
jgi:hypothetical protein